MLILSRMKNEKIMIGDNIVVTIIDLRGGKARLGIDAPADVSVHRQEIWEKVRRQEQQEGLAS